MAGIAVVDIFSYNTTQLYNFELYIKNSDWASPERCGPSRLREQTTNNHPSWCRSPLSFGTTQSYVALAIFGATYAALILRNVRRTSVPIWLILLAGAAAMVLSGSIGVADAYAAVNLQVIVFLFSMFVLVTALDISGALEAFAGRVLRRARRPQDVLYLSFFGFALLSMVLMNDTIALMGTPIMISLATEDEDECQASPAHPGLRSDRGQRGHPDGQPAEPPDSRRERARRASAQVRVLPSDTGPHRPRADRPGAQIPLQEGDWNASRYPLWRRPENRRASGETGLLPGRPPPW